uniref:Uncharacterized protein n=1 Tax=Globodera pallida TaxID=36090 RepID=A0A183BLX1_GLOPA
MKLLLTSSSVEVDTDDGTSKRRRARNAGTTKSQTRVGTSEAMNDNRRTPSKHQRGRPKTKGVRVPHSDESSTDEDVGTSEAMNDNRRTPSKHQRARDQSDELQPPHSFKASACTSEGIKATNDNRRTPSKNQRGRPKTKGVCVPHSDESSTDEDVGANKAKKPADGPYMRWTSD